MLFKFRSMQPVRGAPETLGTGTPGGLFRAARLPPEALEAGSGSGRRHEKTRKTCRAAREKPGSSSVMTVKERGPARRRSGPGSAAAAAGPGRKNGSPAGPAPVKIRKPPAAAAVVFFSDAAPGPFRIPSARPPPFPSVTEEGPGLQPSEIRAGRCRRRAEITRRISPGP